MKVSERINKYLTIGIIVVMGLVFCGLFVYAGIGIANIPIEEKAIDDAIQKLGLKDIEYSNAVGLYHGDLNGERKFVTVVCKGISMRQYECDAWFTSIGDYRVVVQ